MQTVRVSLPDGRGYFVKIGRGLLELAGQEIKSCIGENKSFRAAVITDSVVAPLYLELLTKSLANVGIDSVAFVFPSGEESKNINTLSDILEFLASERITRSDILIALGGGVVGDITGFASGIYLRGLPFVQVPTTLLADVDSSVGGKTAIDLQNGKNLAGVFKQPEIVLCDTACLDTLSDEILADGVAEGIKTGIIADSQLFDIFKSGKIRERAEDIIVGCVRIKGAIVAQDEHDTGKRQLLNLGHTIGHAIECCSNYTLPHGKAVAIGMIMIARAAYKMNICSKQVYDDIYNVIKLNALPTAIDFSVDELYNITQKDKKRFGARINLVVPREIGKCELMSVSLSELKEIIALGK